MIIVLESISIVLEEYLILKLLNSRAVTLLSVNQVTLTSMTIPYQYIDSLQVLWHRGCEYKGHQRFSLRDARTCFPFDSTTHAYAECEIVENLHQWHVLKSNARVLKDDQSYDEPLSTCKHL